MKPTCLSLVLLPLCLTPALLAQKPIAVEASVKKVDPTDRAAKPPVAAQTEQAALSATAAGVTAPEGCSDALLGTFEIQKKKLGIAIGKTDATAELPDVAFIDLNGNGKFDANERQAIEVTKRTMQARGNAPAREVVTGKPLDVTLAIGGTSVTAKLGFQQMGDRASASLSFADYLEGNVTIGDEERVVAVIDKDMDGKYGSAGDLWVLAKPGDRAASAYGMVAMNEGSFLDGKRVCIAVKGKSIEVTAKDATGPDPKDLAGQRARAEQIWSDRFDLERADFVKAREMDTSRPKADKEIHWNYVTFEEGLAMAKKANKPLFVDVMAFWCVWCYRMDYYTYCDKQVADLMNDKFIPVKIIQEQDRVDDYKTMMAKLEAKGIPAMGIFDAEGNKVHGIGGWMKPEKFIEELQQGLK